jgi:hypothetical protein
MKQKTDCPVCGNAESSLILEASDMRYRECPACRVLFLEKEFFPEPEEEHARYRTHRNTADNPGYTDFLARLASPLLERCMPGSRGLDYGCGSHAVLADMLGSAGMDMSVYDPFFHPKRDVLEDSYDFIACSEVVEHFHYPEKEFKRLRSMLKPDGLLGIMTGIYSDEIDFASWYYRRDFTHVVFYRIETFEVIARMLNLTLELPAKNIIFLRMAPEIS